jgi:hypothetical protein
MRSIFVTLSLLFVSLCVSANDWLERADNFSAYSLGQGKVHFKILIYANGSWNNYWVEEHSSNESRAYYQIKKGDNGKDPMDYLSQTIKQMTPEKKQNFLNGANNIGVPQNILSRLQNLK